MATAVDVAPGGARVADSGSGAAGLLDEVRALRADLDALRDRPEPATAADIERLRTELERLATVDRDLSRRLDERLPAASADPAADGVAGVPWTALIAGMLAGWGLARLAQRRKERRQRGRLRV
ncbi:MAG: YeaH/YhbH family protein [Deltaproteobacteria bacterium]|nr:MAG: YeaH/YhbH family protein [Deltaproteobacteria bacterium]TMA67994.1 MAG: YeaH/YhbH family protein [Deltaproteobacteria bacterium]TMB40790.1 MAG: YeaH/YhbH family protein [Deltaproteobacteria bacterium]